MTKTLLLNLFKTFILSVVISTAISCIYYVAVIKGGDYGKAVPVIISAVFYLNGILLVMAVPSLFLSNPDIWTKHAWRMFLYFGGPLAFVITNFIAPKTGPNNVIYIATGVVFLIIHSIIYYRLVK